MARNAISSSFKRLVRFSPTTSPSTILLGEPTSPTLDIGLTLRHNSESITVSIFSGTSILSPGRHTGKTATISRIYSPLARSEVGTIRCIGLNYKSHAKEVNLPLPTTPALFLKPATCLGDPWPRPTVLPRVTQRSDSGDYEAELAVIIGRDAKNVSVGDAMDYVLGYTAANDVSSREAQFATSQWDFSKGFDGACPLGPVVVSKALVPEPEKLRLRGVLNGEVVQDCGVDDLVLGVPQLVTFLSQGTTLPAGTVILTGTPAGVGIGKKPPVRLRKGDEFHVCVEPYVGTLVNVFENEA